MSRMRQQVEAKKQRSLAEYTAREKRRGVDGRSIARTRAWLDKACPLKDWCR